MTQDRVITKINPALAYQKPLDDYIHYLEKMTVRSVRLIEKLVVPWVHYTDPLHDVRGVEDVIRIYQARLNEVQGPKYRIKDHAWGQDGQTVYLRWTFTGKKGERDVVINGVAEVLFTNEGQIMSHKDFVDTAYHPPQPLSLWGRLKKRYSSKAGA